MGKETFSYYSQARISSKEDVIELACALASINQLQEAGEITYNKQDLLKPGQLAAIQDVLRKYSPDIDDNTNFLPLYKRLKELEDSS